MENNDTQRRKKRTKVRIVNSDSIVLYDILPKVCIYCIYHIMLQVILGIHGISTSQRSVFRPDPEIDTISTARR